MNYPEIQDVDKLQVQQVNTCYYSGLIFDYVKGELCALVDNSLQDGWILGPSNIQLQNDIIVNNTPTTGISQ